MAKTTNKKGAPAKSKATDKAKSKATGKLAKKPVAKKVTAKPSVKAAKKPAVKNKSQKLHKDIEAVLLTSGEPITLARFNQVFEPLGVTNGEIKEALKTIEDKYQGTVMELVKGAGGYAFHVQQGSAEAVNLFKRDKPTRYSRALMETLAIIAYKQPITKAEIEELRGVTLSTGIMRSLQEHEWIKIIGYNDVPGKPAIWGTTKNFLDSFKLTSLSELPPIVQDKEDDASKDDAGKEDAGKGEDKSQEENENNNQDATEDTQSEVQDVPSEEASSPNTPA